MPKLHNQIMIALILGAIFGSIFNVDNSKLYIEYQTGEGNVKETIRDWKSFSFLTSSDTTIFKSTSQLEIIHHFRALLEDKTEYFVVVSGYMSAEKNFVDEKRFERIVNISKEKTAAISIKFIGDIFIRLLNMIAIPLVLASLIVGAASLGDIKKLARIGTKTLSYYFVTTALAISIGVLLANLIQPGNRMNAETKNRLMSVYQEDVEEKIDTELNVDVISQIVEMVPKNPFDALSKANMLQIVFFAVMLGVVLTFLRKEKSDPVINFFDGLSEAMIKLVDLVMLIAPIAVFALIAATVGEFGFEILQTLIWYAFTVVLGLALHTFGVYAIMIRMFSRIKISAFYKALKKVMAIAFSTSSSAATLPVNIEACQDNLGISKKITSFVLPLGATINMDGTALYQGVAAVFIAQVYGFDLTFAQQLTIVLTATLASIGTAPVPGVGIIMLIIVLRAIGVPQEGIALIIGVDRILDMLRTITNVTGDASAAVIVATSEKEINVPQINRS